METYLKTERLTLRPLSFREMAAHCKTRDKSILNDEDEDYAIEHFIKPMFTANEEDKLFYTFWVAKDKEGKQVGDIGFKGTPNQFGITEVGYFVYEDFRGKGYAQEMLKGITGWALTTEVNFVIAIVFEPNQPSQNVLTKSGFKLINKKDNISTFIKQIKF